MWWTVFAVVATFEAMLSCSGCPTGNGTTPELRSLLVGRCIEYTTFVNPDVLCKNKTNPDCSAIADSFLSAFAHQPVCNVNTSRYDEFLNSTQQVYPENKMIFFSGVYDFALQYSQKGRRAMTLSDTLSGYMLDLLRFCEAPDQPRGIGIPGLNCQGIDDTEDCEWNAKYSFWVAASIKYASLVRGRITIMLNASKEMAFYNETIFYRWEVPNLSNQSEVTLADIWLIHRLNETVLDTCDGPSILELKRLLKEKSIPSTCSENPTDVLWLLCMDTPQDAVCRGLVGKGVVVSASLFLPFLLGAGLALLMTK